MKSLRAACLVTFCLVSFSALAFESRVQKTLDMSPNGVVSVKAYKGSITVTAGEGSSVEVVARVEPDGDDLDDRHQAEKVAAVKIHVQKAGDGVDIEADYSAVESRRFWSFLSGDHGTLPFVHFTIKMPRTASLEVDDYKSTLKIDDVKGGVRLETYKGHGTLTGVEGTLRMKTYKGELRVEAARLGRDATFETYKGRVQLVVPRGSAFDVDVDRGSRGSFDSDVDVTSRTSSRRRAERLHGSVGSGGAHVRMSTTKGELVLRLR